MLPALPMHTRAVARVVIRRWVLCSLWACLSACGGTATPPQPAAGAGGEAADAASPDGGRELGVGGSDPVSDPISQLGLTPCRDLSANALSVAAAVASPYALLVNELGASVLAIDEQRIVRTFSGQLGTITAGALGADGSWGATVGTDRVLRLWHTADGQQFAHLDLEAQPKLLALSPVGRASELALADDAAGVQLIDAHNARAKWRKTLDGGKASSLSFTPDGQALVLANPRGVLELALSDGAQLSEHLQEGAGVTALSHDGSLLAVADTTHALVEVLNLESGTVRNVIAPRDNVSALTFTSDARQVVIGTASGVSVYDANTGTLVRTLESGSRVNSVALLADGESVLVAANETNLYRLADGSKSYGLGQTGFVWGGSFANDGRLQFPGVAGPTQVWDANRGLRLSLIQRSLESGNQGAVLFSPSGQLLVNFERTATFWDATTTQVVRSFDYDTTEGRSGFNLMIFSKDGSTLIGEGSPPTAGQIRFWDAASGKLLRTLPGHGSTLVGLALSPSGALLASAGAEQTDAQGLPVIASNTIKLWDLTNDTLVVTLRGHMGAISSLEFSADGSRLLSSDRNGLVRLWSVPDGAVLRDLASDVSNLPTIVTAYGYSAAFSPDGKLVASAGVDWSVTPGHTGTIALWAASDGAHRGNLLSLNGANLGSIRWSPDGQLLAAGASTGMRVWCLDELPAASPPPEPPPN